MVECSPTYSAGMYKFILFVVMVVMGSSLQAQRKKVLSEQEPAATITNTTTNTGTTVINNGAANSGSRKDSIGFEHRDDAKDSITISYRILDSVRNIRLDTSYNDFTKYIPLPADLQFLGNTGAAAYSMIFSPYLKPGWDAGFHAYDAYMFTLEESRLYKTTKPFTQINYQVASGTEQIVRIQHTQNPKPNFNFGFDYRLITAPGFMVTQNANHKSYRLFGNYTGKRKRYATYFSILGNTLKSSENGGLKYDSLLYDPNFSRRFTLPVNLGGDAAYLPNPFKSSVNTGNTYKNFTFYWRQSYDIGKKDSVAINDSTMEYLFYPKLRFQHSFSINTYDYQFQDVNADSAIYQYWYDTTLNKKRDSVLLNDQWTIISNDFSLIQFPDTKNLAQFFLAGIRLESISGTFKKSSESFYNIVLHGEYRNKTRNRKWDILLNGQLYLNGLNSGDFSVHASLERFLNKRLGNVRLAFTNTNRSPSYIYDPQSSFNFSQQGGLGKENITAIKAFAENPFFTLSAANYFITNYNYFKDYYQTAQYGNVINILQVSAAKKFKLNRRWNLYSEVTLQQTDAAAPIRLPLLFTRNRLAFEGIFYKNLNLSTGLEFRYNTPFKAYGYSPVTGKFFPQDSLSISNLPDVTAFLHFRIKSFTAYLRAENLNSIGFTTINFAAPHYVYQEMLIRFGIAWRFVN